MVRGRPLVELYDTPGLEDSIGLLEHLERERGSPPARIEGIDQIRTFLASPQADPTGGGAFAQEAKALKQVLASDVALYVIDARDRVLGKHRDELEILARCARPVVPVLNFTASPDAQITLWREHLSRANMHAVAEFDTVVLDEHTERRLLEKMRSLLDRHHATINALIDEREQLRAGLLRTSCSLIADMLIDVAAHQVSVATNDRTEVEDAIDALRQRVRDREQRCVEQLLQLHRFSRDDCLPADLPIHEGRWGIDLFNPAAMKQFGVRTGSAAAAGATAGLALDLISHGLTLGAATALGAAIGGAIGVAHTHGRRLVDRMRGRSELAVDDATLRLLLTRQVMLLRALVRRGHASVNPIRLEPLPTTDESADHINESSRSKRVSSAPGVPRRLPVIVDEIRLHPSWSRLQPDANALALASGARQNAQQRLADNIAHIVSIKPV
jgi:hypothetical protein